MIIPVGQGYCLSRLAIFSSDLYILSVLTEVEHYSNIFNINQTLESFVEPAIQPNGSSCDKKCEVTTLSLQQLSDLQSRLMLVVGRDEERKSDVDTFVEVY